MINQQHLLLPLFTVRLFTSSYQRLPVITHLYVRFIPTVEKHTNLLTSPFQSFPAKGGLLIYKGVHRQSRKCKNNFCRKHLQCRYFFSANVNAVKKSVLMYHNLSASAFLKKLFLYNHQKSNSNLFYLSHPSDSSFINLN